MNPATKFETVNLSPLGVQKNIKVIAPCHFVFFIINLEYKIVRANGRVFLCLMNNTSNQQQDNCQTSLMQIMRGMTYSIRGSNVYQHSTIYQNWTNMNFWWILFKMSHHVRI